MDKNIQLSLVHDINKYGNSKLLVYINKNYVGYIETNPTYAGYNFINNQNTRLYARSCHNIASLKQELIKCYKQLISDESFEQKQESKSNFDIKYLTDGNNKDFFPTPTSLSGQMIACVKWHKVKTILEPSAGKGDICDAIMHYKDKKYYNKPNIDCIELDMNLRLILKGKGYRVVQDDFMAYQTNKRYDLIIMNPPFSKGAEHIMKAIEMQEIYGGQIVCLLNAETLINPYTNLRKLLLKKIKDHKAVVKYIKSPFKKSERKTDVNIAMIYFDIPSIVKESEIYNKMAKAKNIEFEQKQNKELMPNDKIESLLRLYEIETASTISFLQEYNALQPKIMNGTGTYKHPTVTLYIGGHEKEKSIDSETINDYLRVVRLKYWKELFNLPNLQEMMTTSIRNEYQAKIQDMADYDFSIFNIQEVLWDIKTQLQYGIEDEIQNLFDKLSLDHSYYGGSENIHYYTGWKTNKAHKVNYKVIIPSYGSFASRYKYDKYGRLIDKKNNYIDSHSCYSTLIDIEKTFDYINGTDTNRIRMDLRNVLHFAEQRCETKNIECTYFYVTFYKKGTCHITFKEDSKILVDRLNIYVGKNKNWLPPDYGTKSYKNMTKEEQDVILSFNGTEDEYNKVFTNQNNYLLDNSNLIMLSI